ncbi:MAG TPA: hypothetical protein VIR98_00330 [Candidatus Paceibacterota bacterium]|jgi:hypothetical protein
MRIIKTFFALLAIAMVACAPLGASAHEAYVLDQNFFWSELAKPASFESISALNDPANVQVFLIITVCIVAALALTFLLRRFSVGRRISRSFEKLSAYGPVVLRLTIATAFFFSAASQSFLGPELPLTVLPFAPLLRIALFISAVCITLGLFTRIAALLALIVYSIGFFHFGFYVTTYLNYLGEILVLLLFGSGKWSLDVVLFKRRELFSHFKKYETTIVRVCYGAALIFAAITVKFFHPALTIEVVQHWDLTRFHWLFPHDPLLVTLGAGLSEFAIGLFIIFGFEMRLTVLVSLFYITLSLLFFRELVWPHLMLYGVSINLLVQPEIFTLDHVFFDRKGIKLWKRPFQPHIHRAK